MFCFCLISTSFAQKMADTKLLDQATREFSNMRYMNASRMLERFVRADSTNVRAQEMLAYSYRKLGNFQGALKWYERLNASKDPKAEWVLYAAQALANNQQYERSLQFYRKYLGLVKTDRRAAGFVSSQRDELEQNSNVWSISLSDVNTGASDYSPFFFKGGLAFVSNRESKGVRGHLFPWNNTPYSDLYYIEKISSIGELSDFVSFSFSADSSGKPRGADLDDTPLTSNDSAVPFVLSPLEPNGIYYRPNEAVVKLYGNLNTRMHEGPASAFPDGSIIFTRNNYYHGKAGKDKYGVNRLKMFIASGEKLSKIIPFPYNNDQYSVGHPALSTDGNVLIFASDMPGGYGGTDLYYCVGSNYSNWTRPINLGPEINTEGDEMFPFLSADNILYFASNGLPGLGGLDLFSVPLKNLRPQFNPLNLGVPVNSFADDFGLTANAETGKYFFSSNRNGNDDIYHLKRGRYKIVLEGVVRDAETNIPLAHARVNMRFQNGVDTVQLNGRGEFRRELAGETDYELTARHRGYVNQMKFLSSTGVNRDSVIRANFYLVKASAAQQKIISSCDSLKGLFATENIYYDLDRYAIRSDAKPALDRLIGLMNRYPEISIITSSHCDTRASLEYNRLLSLRRGEAAKKYLTDRGIPGSRITVAYYGKTRLVNNCADGVPCSEAQQQLNRRTEFDVLLNGVNITQMNCDEER